MNLVHKSSIALALLVAVGVSAVRPAQAQFFQNTTGIAAPVQTITFDEFVFAANTPLSNQYSSLGVTFSPGITYSPQNFPAPNIDATNIGNFAPITSPVSIFFNSTQTSAGFAFVSNAGTSTFTALLNNVVVATATAPTGTTISNDFYGFSGIAFNEITFVPGGSNNAFLLDNLQTGTANAAVPEPSATATLGLGVLALFGMAFAARKRRATIA